LSVVSLGVASLLEDCPLLLVFTGPDALLLHHCRAREGFFVAPRLAPQAMQQALRSAGSSQAKSAWDFDVDAQGQE